MTNITIIQKIVYRKKLKKKEGIYFFENFENDKY